MSIEINKKIFGEDIKKTINENDYIIRFDATINKKLITFNGVFIGKIKRILKSKVDVEFVRFDSLKNMDIIEVTEVEKEFNYLKDSDLSYKKNIMLNLELNKSYKPEEHFLSSYTTLIVDLESFVKIYNKNKQELNKINEKNRILNKMIEICEDLKNDRLVFDNVQYEKIKELTIELDTNENTKEKCNFNKN